MARDVKQLHPELQKKITELKELCKKNGITIGISECLRTVAEQDALYAKGRTAAGSVVTNCKGNTYSSMHQWGNAFDFYLIMDVDGDGKSSDDAFNNATKLFDKVGKLGESIGLEWGGSWKSIKDKPHFQLPYWGSTTTELKKKYGTPEKFFAIWNKDIKVNQSSNEKKPTASKNTPEPAKSKNKKYVKPFTTQKNVNLMLGAGTSKGIVLTIPKGKTVMCYGYYTKVGSSVWLFIQYGKYSGYIKKNEIQ